MKTLFRALLMLSLAIPTAPIRLAAQDADPVAVLDARQRAFEARNLDAAMAWFADDAVVTVLVGTPRQARYVGRDAIQRWQETLLNERSVRVESAGDRRVEGDTVTWTARVSRAEWQAMGLESLELWGEAVVRDGKISSLRNGLTPASAEKLGAAVARQKGQ